MAYGMSTSLEPKAILRELDDWLKQTVSNPQERKLWEEFMRLSRVGWYAVRATRFVGVTKTLPTGVVGSAETGAVYGSGDNLVLLQAWREVNVHNASTGVRAIRVDAVVGRLGHLIVRDGADEYDQDISINEWIARHYKGVQKTLGYVRAGVDHSEITGHASMTEQEVREQALWTLEQIALAGAEPNAELTSNFGPTVPR